jgi:propionate CoA-transferase
VERIRRIVAGQVGRLGRKVYAIVNYDGFSIVPDLLDEYTDMVGDLMRDCYSGVTRYTTSGFLRMKLGDALSSRKLAPHIYETADEARERLRALERTAAN